MMITVFLISLSIAHHALASGECEKTGGSCVDYRETKCIAGVSQGLCPGFWYDRCCMACDKTCLESHTLYKLEDGACNNKTGTCMDNSNFCEGKYIENHCGGPEGRQCCVKG